MNTHTTTVARNEASKNTFARAETTMWLFLAAFLGMFFVSVSVAATLDLLPNTTSAIVAEGAKVNLAASAIVATQIPTLPTQIEIPSISLSVSISNPTSTDVKVLDNALLKGSVRYPTSAKLGEKGNVVLFGHSSYLPLVNNKAFKAFDDIQKLKTGDEIVVSDGVTEYTYAVESVAKASADADSIPLTVTGSKLTLVTCNSFASSADRFVVTATLVRSNPLGT